MSAGIIHFLDKDNIKSQTFLTSGSFTVPNGITRVIVEGQGAGGAGARSPYAQGGGAGAHGLRFLNVTPGENLSVVIGTGGSGLVGGIRNGNNGGSTSVTGGSGSLLFPGGKGGLGSDDPGVFQLNGSGNGGSGGFVALSPGSATFQGDASGQNGISGGGGTGFVGLAGIGGGGGGSAFGTGGNGSDGTPTAGGLGAGGGGRSNGGGAAGADGGNGVVIIYWIDVV